MSILNNLINGISLGSVYAIIALGYTMVYGIAKMLNFAHGDVIMVGAYICFFTMSGLSGSFEEGSLAGALYAMNYSSIAAKKFDFNTSILILVYVVLGGLGNIRGSVIAAALLYVLPELLRDFYDYRMLIYAIVLILVMLATNNERSKEFFSSLRRKILGRGTEKGGAQNG